MNVKIIIRYDENDDEMQRLSINDKEVCAVYPLCESPEDAKIGRDLLALTTVAEYMKRAYDAGVNGETWEYEEIVK